MSLPSASTPGRRAPSAFEFNCLSSALNDYPPSPVNSYSSNGSDGISATSPRVDHKVTSCFRCKCSEVVAALVPCGHHIFCQSCAMEVVTQKGDCPICHIEAESMLRIYHD
jgi:RNA-binding protein MEX3